jgi:hypothetical protein
MFSHGLFVISEKIGNVGNGHTALKKYSRESVAEAVRSWTFFELTS